MVTFEVDQNDFVGSGRSGNVYRAFFDGQIVAVKYCTDPDLFDEMANEAKILSHLNKQGCPNVPTLIHSYKKNREYFIIMQYIDGVPVKFDERNCRLEQALKEVHKCHVLHGDIREENFLVTKGGKVFVIDFGFSKISQNDSDFQCEFNDLRCKLGLRPLRVSQVARQRL